MKWKGKTFICIKPTTYMNLSGKAVKYWLEKEKIEKMDCKYYSEKKEWYLYFINKLLEIDKKQ